MKIALLGNTCNNNFAWLRYFRDLGADAHLLLYSNEGLPDSNPIHNPEWDTWDIGRYSNYIHRLAVPNGIEGLVGRPDKFRMRPSTAELNQMFSGYDIYIGSGISPGLFARMGRSLSLFYPYSTGVEWVGEGETAKKLRTLNLQLPFRLYVKKMQVLGIRTARLVSNTALDETQTVLRRIRPDTLVQYIPQYYNREEIPKNVFDPAIDHLLQVVGEDSFRIFSHMRHHWVYDKRLYDVDTWPQFNKNNQWLIEGFARLVADYPAARAKLILVEWGKDVNHTKQLCASLDIERDVIWLPLLKRKQISRILSYCCDIAVGEFCTNRGAIWGSTGWEGLASGRPLLQAFNFHPNEFIELFGHPPPELLDAKSSEDVYDNLVRVYRDPKLRESLGISSKQWFDKNNGISLAEDWLVKFQSLSDPTMRASAAVGLESYS